MVIVGPNYSAGCNNKQMHRVKNMLNSHNMFSLLFVIYFLFLLAVSFLEPVEATKLPLMLNTHGSQDFN